MMGQVGQGTVWGDSLGQGTALDRTDGSVLIPCTICHGERCTEPSPILLSNKLKKDVNKLKIYVMG